MLDYAYMTVLGPAASPLAGGSALPGRAVPAPAAGIRALLARLVERRSLERRDPPANAAPGAGEPVNPALRAWAHAAYRTVAGAGEPALDAALAVMEDEIVRMRGAVLAYGEALKSIQVYANDDDARRTAYAALRARPERLAAAGPVPAEPAGQRHG